MKKKIKKITMNDLVEIEKVTDKLKKSVAEILKKTYKVVGN